MIIRDLFLDVLRTLWAHKLRAALTMFGIAWGIVSIVLMVAAGEGLRVGQAKVSATLGRDVMIIFAGTTSMQAGGARAGRRIRWDDTDVPILQQEATDCEDVLPELGQGNIRVTSNFNSGAFEVTGSTPPFEQVRSTEVGTGRFYNWDDYHQARKVAFIGSEVKKQLFGSRNPLGQTLMVRDTPFTVIGVMKEKDQDSSYDGFDVNKVFVPYTVMQREFPNKPPDTMHTLDRLLVTPKSVAQHESCKNQIAKVLGRIHRFDPTDKEALHNWDTLEEAQAFQRMTDGMKYFLGAVGLTTLFLGGLGVMNVMLVAVRERTREIGVRKAVGAAAGEIRRQFFLETLLLVLVSGGVGLGIAYGLCALVDMMPMPQYFAGLIPTWQSGVLSVGLLGTIAILSAMYPANKAATIDPIEALRYEAGG
ncbi:MAG: ABC transporter permease [Terriglobales bacterium]